MKEIQKKLDSSSVNGFKERLTSYFSTVFSSFDDYEFYLGESSSDDGMVVLMNYREDGLTPYFIFIKDGLVEEKCVSFNFLKLFLVILYKLINKLGYLMLVL